MSEVHSTSADKQGQLRESGLNFVRYHGVTPPPNNFLGFVGRERSAPLRDLFSAVASLEALLVATRPAVALSHWRLRAVRLHAGVAR